MCSWNIILTFSVLLGFGENSGLLFVCKYLKTYNYEIFIFLVTHR